MIGVIATGNQVDQIGEYKIYRSGHEFIIHNSKYPFKQAHTHGIKSLDKARYIIRCVRKNRLPGDLGVYLLISLTRISDDKDYITKVNELIEVKKSKQKQKYTVQRSFG